MTYWSNIDQVVIAVQLWLDGVSLFDNKQCVKHAMKFYFIIKIIMFSCKYCTLF